MKRFPLCCLLLSLHVMAVTAQENINGNYREAYEAFRQKAKGDYEEFRRRCNDEYARFVEQAWQAFQRQEPLPAPKEEKPVAPVECEDTTRSVPQQELRIAKILPAVEPIPQPAPIAPIKEQPQPADEQFRFSFCGTDMTVRLAERHRFRMEDSSEAEVARAWRFCSQPFFDNIVRDCLALRLTHGLSDWAYLNMLLRLGQSFLGNDTNEAVLLAAWIYGQSGYAFRLGRGDSGRLVLLVSSEHLIYKFPYFKVDGHLYYPVGTSEERLHICQAAFPGEQPLSLWMSQTGSFTFRPTEERRLQSGRYPQVSVTLQSNGNLIDFLNTYPISQAGDDFMTKWGIYANTQLSADVAAALYPPLHSAIEGCTQQEATNRLLNFVQTAFEYEYDDKVWGYDRPFFAEETLFYPYCDCEDRSILFSRLVRDLMGVDVVLVYYPGHLATAVAFTEDVAGDYLMVGGRKFVVCDPTFINAPVGRTMPDMNNAEACVLRLMNND